MQKTYQGEPLDIIHTVGLDTVYPVVRCQIDFAKSLTLNRLANAVQKVSKIIPEIFCRYEIQRNTFIPVTENATNLIRIDVAEPDTDAATWDLMTEPQLRIYWQTVEQKTRLIFYISHILADGAGSKQLLALIARAYRQDQPALTGVVNHQEIDWLIKLVAAHSASQRPVDHPAQPLMLPPIKSTEPQKYRVGSLTLTKKETTNLLSSAREQHVTVNDVVMTAFGRVIQQLAGVERIALACPTDMRPLNPTPVGGYQIANLTSRYNFDVAVAATDSFATIVQKVHAEMAQNKKNHQCFDSIQGLLDQYQHAPLAMLQQTIQANYHMRSIAYTNFGVLNAADLNFGEVSIESLTITGGFRRMPNFQIAVGTFADRLTLAFNMIGTDAEFDQGLRIAKQMAELIQIF